VPGDEVHCKRPGDEVHCKRPMRSKEERTHTPLPLGCAPCPPRARALLLTQSRARAPSVRASSMVIAPLAARSRRAPRPLSSVGEPDMPGALDSACACIEAGRPERWAASLGLPRRDAGWLVLDLGVIGESANLADGHARDTPRFATTVRTTRPPTVEPWAGTLQAGDRARMI
jgi:hypothetical protein